MNLHLATYPQSDSLHALWMTDHPGLTDETAYELTGATLPRSKKLELSFRRLVIGMSFDPLFVVVVGERTFEYLDRISTVYLPLDEALDTDIPAETMNRLIELKDRYRATTIFCPSEPASMVETISRLEGLTHYPAPRIEAGARTRWPSFTDFDLIARIRSVPLPAEATISSELNALFSEIATDPRSEKPMIGADSLPVPRLLFLDDFPIYRTLQCVRTNTTGGVIALWLAVMGLERSTVYRPSKEDRERERERVLNSGRRNPTGY